MIIGRFAENPATGLLIGHIRTLFFKSDKVVFEPIAEDGGKRSAKTTEKIGGKPPSHRIYTADEVELGAAWRMAGKTDGAIYYDVTLDDPTFATPVRARLVQSKQKGTGLILIWDRQSKSATTERKVA
jgi:uncharacterized protein (DUF736 family)